MIPFICFKGMILFIFNKINSIIFTIMSDTINKITNDGEVVTSMYRFGDRTRPLEIADNKSRDTINEIIDQITITDKEGGDKSIADLNDQVENISDVVGTLTDPIYQNNNTLVFTS